MADSDRVDQSWSSMCRLLLFATIAVYAKSEFWIGTAHER